MKLVTGGSLVYLAGWAGSTRGRRGRCRQGSAKRPLAGVTPLRRQAASPESAAMKTLRWVGVALLLALLAGGGWWVFFRQASRSRPIAPAASSAGRCRRRCRPPAR